MVKYLLVNGSDPETNYIDDGIDELRESLRDTFLLAFGLPIEDGDERLKDTFRYFSKSRFKSIDTMEFEQIKEEFFNEFGWIVTEVEGENQDENNCKNN